MPEFRTKGRGKGRQAYPISARKKNRKDHSNYKINPPEESPPEEKVLEEKMQEEKAQKKHKLAKPSYSTKHVVRHDIKNMMRKEDSQEYGSKDYVNYKKKLDRDADHTYSKENRKAKKRRKKETKKEEKQQKKEAEQTT